MKANKHILVTGIIRSGTTFTGRILNFSSNIIYLWEPFQVGLKSYRKDGVFDYWFEYVDKNSSKTNSIKLFLKKMTTLQLSDFWRLNVTNRSKFSFELRNIYKKAVSNLFLKESCTLYKDPIAVFSIEWFLYNFNDCKIIVMLRNPVSFVESIVKLEWNIDFSQLNDQTSLLKQFPADIIERIEFYSENSNTSVIDKAILFWKIVHYFLMQIHQEHPENILFVKLEDINKNPAETLTKIYKYSGINLTKKIRKKINNLSKLRKEDWITNSSSKFDKDQVIKKKKKDKIIEETSEIAHYFKY